MTVKFVGNKRNLSEETRLAKNKAISEAQRATRLKRKNQICKVRDIKIVDNKLSALQRETLERIFLEAKWLRNDCIASGIDGYKPSSTVSVKLPDNTFEIRNYKALGSQMKQSIVTQVKRDNKNLQALRKKKPNIAKQLRFSSSVNSVDLVQFGMTYRFVNDRKTKMKIQNIPKHVRVRGAEQIKDGECANAKLVKRADGYHILITCFYDKKTHKDVYKHDTIIGIDMGLKASITLSNGDKLDVSIGETERLKRLQKKAAKQKKNSNNQKRTYRLIQKEYLAISNKRQEAANQIVHKILQNETVCMQDENITSWKKKKGCVRGGKTVQRSILGRVKAKLIHHDRVIVLKRNQPTTAYCNICGNKTKHTPDKRMFTCNSCGHTADRDIHAACNMIRLAVLTSPGEPRLARVEEMSDKSNKALSNLAALQSSMKHETPLSLAAG